MYFSKFSKFIARSLGLSLMFSCCNFSDTFAMERKSVDNSDKLKYLKFINHDCRQDCPNKQNIDNSYVYYIDNRAYNLCYECAQKISCGCKPKSKLPCNIDPDASDKFYCTICLIENADIKDATLCKKCNNLFHKNEFEVYGKCPFCRIKDNIDYHVDNGHHCYPCLSKTNFNNYYGSDSYHMFLICRANTGRTYDNDTEEIKKQMEKESEYMEFFFKFNDWIRPRKKSKAIKRY